MREEVYTLVTRAAAGRTLQVQVRLLGYLSRYAGARQIALSLPAETTAAGLLQALVGQYGDDFGEVLLDSAGRLQGGVEMMVNGQQIPARRIEEIPIPAGSEVVIIPLIGGG